jgi:hypothetical protein
MTDLFISYTSADQAWAEWIGHVLEDNGLSVTLQAWDFRPGSNFVLEMHKAAATADRTLLVLSPDYMKSQFAAPEWATAFAQDPQGLERRLVPVMVRNCTVEGLLKPLVHINLVGLDEEQAAARLLSGVRLERAKPDKRPAFPGPVAPIAARSFPGAVSSEANVAAAAHPYVPKVKRAATDIEKRRFLKHAFERVAVHFRGGLDALSRATEGADFDYQQISAAEFTAEIFLNGKSVTACKIWEGRGMAQNGISYAEGRHHGDNSCNEILTLTEAGGDLGLQSLIGGFGFGRALDHLDLKALSPDQAAEYLWRRFVAPLER